MIDFDELSEPEQDALASTDSRVVKKYSRYMTLLEKLEKVQRDPELVNFKRYIERQVKEI